MASIQFSLDDGKKQTFQLEKEITTIGRTDDNDIQLDNLAVSSHHAKILTILNDSFIEDTGSTNGTYLNGTSIKKQALRHKDVIKVGKHEITYINEAGAVEDEFSTTMIINPDAIDMQEIEGDQKINQSVSKIVAEIASSDSESNRLQKAKIRIISGANIGRELPLTKVLTTLGQPGVQVAAITRRPAGYFIMNIDGGENTQRARVNNREIGARAHPLNDNDIFEVAGIKMSFLVEPENIG
ncbi:MAG TPA: FHA domain-containing protein [Gammaproteobacteria bacterium]|nr:FHA domain-containing protein [Gammaproteobacteria bacterium]